MQKGEKTKNRVLNSALNMVSQSGLELLTIGTLADSTGMSKSGLFAHFKSKEKLQTDLLEHASVLFAEQVIMPSLKRPRGLARIRVINRNWIEWVDGATPGGCVFIAASFEYDDRTGPVRDCLHKIVSKWQTFLALAARQTVRKREFGSSTDCEQFAYEFFSQMLGYHLFRRMLTQDKAKFLQSRSFENLISRYRQKPGNKR